MNEIKNKHILMDGVKRVAFSVLLVLVSLGTANAQPAPRWGHRAALLDNTLYVQGGELKFNSGIYTTYLLSLDVTKSFTTIDVPWNESSDSGGRVAYHSLTVGGLGHRSLISYGGVPGVRDVAVFDTTQGSWDTWNEIPANVTMHTGVAPPNSSVTYIFGGFPPPNSTLESNMLTKVNTIEETIESNPGPFRRIQHSATMLGGDMYVIGGDTNGQPVSMTDIRVYNTETDEWSRQTAKGDVPSPRRNHAAVAWGRDIIVYGGDDARYAPSVDTLAVLNVDSMTWSKPSTKGTSPPGRALHSMNMVGSNAIITFGYYPGCENEEVNVFILNVEDFTWTTQYVPNSHTPNSETDNGKSTDIPVIVVAVLASVLVAAVAAIMLVRYLRRRAHRRNIFATSTMNLASGTLTTDSSLGMTQSPQSPYSPQMSPSSDMASHASYAYSAHSPSSISEGYAMAGQSPHISRLHSSHHGSNVMSEAHVAMMQGTYGQGTYGVVMQGAHNPIMQRTDDQGAHDVIMQGPHFSIIQRTDDQGAHDVVMAGAHNIMAQEAQRVNALEPPSATMLRSSSPPTSEVVEPAASAETGHRDLHNTDRTVIP